jgi:hypothetical protein
LLLEASGLAPILRTIESGAKPLSNVLPGADLHTVLTSQFDPYLSSMSLEITKHLQPLHSPRYAQKIGKQCALKFVEAYRSIVTAAMDDESGYTAPRTTILVRTIEEVATLLGVWNAQ